jgi:hypothetical protein
MTSVSSIFFALAITLFGLSSATASIPQPRSREVSIAQPRATLWTPGLGLKWEYILNGSIGDIDSSVDVYDVDLYDTSEADWSALKNAGKSIICYFSAGSFENWRADANQFNRSDYGADLPGWAGEFWLDTNSANVRRIMSQRLVDAANRGCDGVDPDNSKPLSHPLNTIGVLNSRFISAPCLCIRPLTSNIVDAYNNRESSKLGLTVDTAKDYLTFLNLKAKQLNLAIGLKNGIDLAETVSTWLDWQVNEQCVAPLNKGPDECQSLHFFIDKNKPVFHVEYDEGVPNNVSPATVTKLCDKTTTAGFSSIIKNMQLTKEVVFCQ